jgi:TonB family protein
VPPEPRQLILPPLDYPRAMRGRTVAVTFWVKVDGRVERVELDQPIDDRGFQKKFLEVMRHYRFRPARGPDGLVVPGVTTVTVTF